MISLSNVCHCCLVEGSHKVMTNEYVWDGEKEIYSHMLADTLNVKITYQDNGKDLICEFCIAKLRNAVAFKKQVEKADWAIVEAGKNLKIAQDRDIEAAHAEEDNCDSFEECMSNDSDPKSEASDHLSDFGWEIDENAFKEQDNGHIFVIKLEPKEEPPELPNKKPTKITSNLKHIRNDVIKSVIKKDGEKGIGLKEPDKKKKTPCTQHQMDLRENTIKLILNSNMVMFKSLKTRFKCYGCTEEFFTINEFRDHSETHTDTKYITVHINRLRGLTYKSVDISNLKCKICSKSLHDLNDLRTHLNEHGIQFANAEHLLVPYKLLNAEHDYFCVICNQKYNTFMRLSIHMNSHYTNNVCEICGISFINRMSLRLHVQGSHKEKKCSMCPATFVSPYLRMKHMQKVHNTAVSKRYCLTCRKTFRYTYQLIEHRVQEHGMKRNVSKCEDCGKTFVNPQYLKVHVRSVHIKERNHPCSACDMSFFTKCDQKRHERTHYEVKMLTCHYCNGRFKTRDSWRRHGKRQHGDIEDWI